MLINQKDINNLKIKNLSNYGNYTTKTSPTEKG